MVWQEDLIKKCLHPLRMIKFLNKYNYDIVCEEYI
jgi:hypothetical protein